AQAAGGDIPVEKRKIAADVDLGTHRHGAEDVQPIIVFRAYVHRNADGGVGIYRVADGIARIVRNERLDIVDLMAIEQDNVERSPFLKGFAPGEFDTMSYLRLQVRVAGGNVLRVAGIDIGVQPAVVRTLDPFGIGDLDRLFILKAMGKDERRSEGVVTGNTGTG